MVVLYRERRVPVLGGVTKIFGTDSDTYEYVDISSIPAFYPRPLMLRLQHASLSDEAWGPRSRARQ